MPDIVLSPEAEAKLAEKLASFYDDPLGFVLFAYPWGQPFLADGSKNDLADMKGPEPWQRRLLENLGRHIRSNVRWSKLGAQPIVWRSARASGHGVGKSAEAVWLIHFFMSTRRMTRGIVTANTGGQLETKTWPELARWHNRLICSHWFQWTSTSYYFKKSKDPEQQKQYMVNAVTVSPDNMQSFAGLHNKGNTIFAIFDEASEINRKVWEIIQGAFTDGECFFFAFGNPTDPSGEFADCFGINKELYDTETIDSRDISWSNKAELEKQLKMWGEDSDQARVRIKGQFPTQAFDGFISAATVDEAMERELIIDPAAPLIMAVDCARFGNDRSVIGFRQGRDARSRKPMVFTGLSITKLAEITMTVADKTDPDAIVIEGGGSIGVGVIDIIRDRGYRVIETHPGAPSSEPLDYANVRAENWSKMRNWLTLHGCIPMDKELAEELLGLRYGFKLRSTAIQMEDKEEYKKRTNRPSPDKADMLSLTFACNVARRDRKTSRRRDDRQQAVTEYDPISY